MLELEKIYESIDEAIEELRDRRKALLEKRNKICDEMEAIREAINAMERIKEDMETIDTFDKKYNEENEG